ncbi:MAG TPA: ATP-binding protein, partial [Polyangiaceae bacterium]|nr:ATP-binding protein [Polyangiaceae bacterium]
MKEFSHPDQKEKAPADLNRALQTALALARNEYKLVADVETELGEVPPVTCHVGELNQVFLNIIVNAAHAIGDVVARTGGRGRIHVKTWSADGFAWIAIADSGGGIPEAIRDKVFEPFFTTKEVGRGTGQGLAIARSVVVDKHGGTLTFDSVAGEGTTFSIRLPLSE